jgi:hypothetical protein
MFAQLFTLGLLTVAAAGGAALGYGVRTRQEKYLRAREQRQAERLVLQSEPLPALEAQPETGKHPRRPDPRDGS